MRWRTSIAGIAAVAALAGCSAAPEESPVILPPTFTLPPAHIEDAAARIERETHTQVGISLFDGTSSLTAGSLEVLPAWSTIKVPIALAADEHCPYEDDVLSDLIASAIEISDNDSATALWSCLGPDAEASRLVGEEIAKSGEPVQVEPFFGTTDWPVAAQARYARYLADLPEDNPVIEDMHLIDNEHRYGLGNLADVPFKGGWSDTPDGAWHSRQMGFVSAGGTTYGIAIAAASAEGSEDDTKAALDALAAHLAEQLDITTTADTPDTASTAEKEAPHDEPHD